MQICGWGTDPSKRSGYRAHHRREAFRKAGIGKEEGIHTQNTSAEIVSRGIRPFRRRGSLRYLEADVQPEGSGEHIRHCPSPSRLRSKTIRYRADTRKTGRAAFFRDAMGRLDSCIRTSEDEKGDDWKLYPLSKKDHELLGKLGL